MEKNGLVKQQLFVFVSALHVYAFCVSSVVFCFVSEIESIPFSWL